MIDLGAKIVMLGCGLAPNTTMHALEEYAVPPYLFGTLCRYTITDWEGQTYTKEYRRHGFEGWRQRYDRVALLPNADIIQTGKVLEAPTSVLDTPALKAAVLAKLRAAPLFFVERVETETGSGTD